MQVYSNLYHLKFTLKNYYQENHLEIKKKFLSKQIFSYEF